MRRIRRAATKQHQHSSMSSAAVDAPTTLFDTKAIKATLSVAFVLTCLYTLYQIRSTGEQKKTI
jgi:hypothetical protein